MTASESFLLLIRWLHNLAAVTWVGGSLLFVLVVRPLLQAHPNASPLAQALGTQFRGIVDVCILVLVATGGILLVDRLTASYTGGAYIAVVTLKIVAALWLFWTARGLRRRVPPSIFTATPTALATHAGSGTMARLRRMLTGANGAALIGVGILLLADVLRWLVEQGLSS